MFIFDVEVVEVEKHLALPSTVGLYDIYHESLDVFAGSLFQASDGTFKGLLGLTERKLGEAGGGIENLNPRMVEGGSKIMDSVPQNKDELVWRGISRSNAEDVLLGIKVEFNCERVRVRIREDLSQSVKLIDVLLGPFNL